MEVAALGVHRLHRERVRREAEVEPRVLIVYFCGRASGLTNIVKAIQSTAVTMRGPAGA